MRALCSLWMATRSGSVKKYTRPTSLSSVPAPAPPQFTPPLKDTVTRALLAPVGAVVFTLLVSALLVWWAGADVAQTYGLLLRGGFGSVFALSETFTRAIPLMLTGLAAAVAFRARLFNIGAEGQLYVGALAAVAVGGLHGGSGFDLPVPAPCCCWGRRCSKPGWGWTRWSPPCC